jgi:uncharacterized short protein YbdD (DUF466 family)
MLDEWRDVTPSLRSGQALSAAKGRSLEWLEQFLSTLRQVAGMPDYAAHVEHLREKHPEHVVPSERQYYDDFIRARYGDGPTRCC